eukprot:PRCOL_00006095-RA
MAVRSPWRAPGARSFAARVERVPLTLAIARTPAAPQLHPGGVIWKKSGGATNKLIDIKKEDVAAVSLAAVPKMNQLSVRQRNGKEVVFYGLASEQETAAVSQHCLQYFGVECAAKEYSITGHNWGEAELEGAMLRFSDKNGKPAFEFPLGDVATAQVQGKNEVQIGFHTDDTNQEKDSLVELTFYVPPGSEVHPPTEEGTAAQTLHEKLLERADIGTATGEAVASMEDLYVVVPRGRFTAEMHPQFMRLLGTANDFKVQYSSMLRIFVLPRSAGMPGGVTWVNVALDPPLRKGQTYYPHLLLQFPSDDMTDLEIDIDPDVIAERYGDKLESSYSAPTCEVFAKVLRGLSNTKITRPGSFQSPLDGQAVRCSFKTEEGMLFPLEKSFFYAPKPPLLILYEDVNDVEFQRQSGGTSHSSKTFDLVVTLKSDQEYQFRSIQRQELANLLAFFKAKGVRVSNLKETQAAADGNERGARASLAEVDDDDDDDDSGSDPDEDFTGAESDEPSDEDEDYGSGSDGSDDEAPKKKKSKK